MNKLLWILQALLATLFLFAGVTKLVMPIEQLTAQQALSDLQFSGAFLRFIGVVETLGAIGLIVPWALRIRPSLTPLAAAGLVIVMIGATVATLMNGQLAAALVPLVAGLAAAFVAWGRFRTPRAAPAA